jgi:hypothetical protein
LAIGDPASIESSSARSSRFSSTRSAKRRTSADRSSALVARQEARAASAASAAASTSAADASGERVGARERGVALGADELAADEQAPRPLKENAEPIGVLAPRERGPQIDPIGRCGAHAESFLGRRQGVNSSGPALVRPTIVRRIVRRREGAVPLSGALAPTRGPTIRA